MPSRSDPLHALHGLHGETGSRIGCRWAQVWAVLGELGALGGDKLIADSYHEGHRDHEDGLDSRLRGYDGGSARIGTLASWRLCDREGRHSAPCVAASLLLPFRFVRPLDGTDRRTAGVAPETLN